MAVNRRLGRPSEHRMLMLRNLVTSLLKNGRIITTVARAKETRSMTEKMITLAKRAKQDESKALHLRRRAMAFITDETVVKELFDDIGPRYEDVEGGYTRIIRIGPRRGDAAEMAVLELV